MQFDEKNLKYFLDMSSNMIQFVDSNGRIIYANEEWKRKLGYAEKDFDSISYFDLIRPDFRSHCRGEWKKLLSGKILKNFETVLVAKNGKMIDVIANSTPKISRGKFETAICSFNDVTEKNNYEKRIALDEQRLNGLLSVARYSAKGVQDLLGYALDRAIILTSSKIGYIYFYDERTKKFTLNRWSKGVVRHCKMSNPKASSSIERIGILGEAVRQGKPVMLNNVSALDRLKKCHPEGLAPFSKYLALPVFSGKHIVAVAAVANKQTDYADEDARQLTLLMDSVWKIAESKKAELKLSQLASIFENSYDAIIGKTLDGTIEEWNRAAEKLYGYSAKEIAGKNVSLLIPKDRPNELKFILSRIKTGIPIENFETKRKCKDGSIIDVSLTISPIKDGEGRIVGISTIARDITELRAAENLIKNYAQNLEAEVEHRSIALVEEKRKVEAMSSMKDEFVRNVTHELKTPLSVILGSLGLLSDSVRGENLMEKEKLTELLEMLGRNAQRLSHSVNQIVEFDELKTLYVKKEQMLLHNLMDEIYHEFLPIANIRNIALKLKVVPVSIDADRELLRVAISNLVSNAIKFTEKGEVVISAKAVGKNVEIAVSDTGQGISKGDLAKVYDQFFKANPSAPGTGIGLTLAKEIVEKHGGKINAESKLGAGSKFRIIIPQA